MTDQWRAEITWFQKDGGPLTKRIALDPSSGKPDNDSSACRMSTGSAWRVDVADIHAFADLINKCGDNQALAIGRLKNGLPNRVRVVAADKLGTPGASNGVPFMITNAMKNNLRELGHNDEAIANMLPTDAHIILNSAVIARTKEFIEFKPDAGGFVLLDFDPKWMSAAVLQRMQECGGLIPALVNVLPALETAAMVVRASTSSGLRNSRTGEIFAGSGGMHLFIPVADASDIPRFLSDFHARLWLTGFGWGAVSAAGSFLERSLVDQSCGSPERLIFEARPSLVSPLVQDARPAVAHEGTVLDTRLCPPLSDEERPVFEQFLLVEEARLLPERQRARASWSLDHIARLVKRGIPEPEARRQIDDWIDRKELSGAFPLPFDDQTITGHTVEQVIAEPNKYIGKHLSDPHEGPSYGKGKAIVYQRQDGSLFINSFAHGGISYELKQAPPSKSPTCISTVGAFPIDEASIPQRPWLVPGLMMRRQVSVIVAPPASGKSLLSLPISISCALRMPWAGWRPRERARTLLVNAEDDKDEQERRLCAAAKTMGVDQAALVGWIRLADDPSSIVLAKFDAKTKTLVRTPLMAQLIETITAQEIDALWVDPFAETFEGDENSNSELKWAAVLWREIARTTNSAVLLNHHAKKYATGMAGDMDAARGGGSLAGVARILSTMFPMSKEEAESFDIAEADRVKYVRYDDAKATFTLKTGQARWFVKNTYTINNATADLPGDEVGVLMPWKPPGLLDGVSNATINRILDEIDRGYVDDDDNLTDILFGPARTTNKDAKMDRWVGRVITRHLKCTDEKAAEIITLWLNNGILVEEPTLVGRHARKGVRSNTAKRPGSEADRAEL